MNLITNDFLKSNLLDFKHCCYDLDYVEHAPVMSTDRLEKPKPAPPTNEPNNNITNNNSHNNNNGSLPRNFSRIAIHQKGGGLKRNASMSDVTTKNSFVAQQQHQPQRHESQAVNGQNHNGSRPASNQIPRTTSMSDMGTPSHGPQATHESMGHIQVPPHIVKSIVVSVLDKQGVPNPSDQIINKAIEEYYAKNPNGVSG